MPVPARSLVGGLLAVVAFTAAACSGSSATAAPTAPAVNVPSFAIPSFAIPSIPAIGGAGGSGSAGGSGAGGGAALDAGTILTPDVATSIIGGQVSKVPIPSAPGFSLVTYANSTGGAVTAMVETVPAGAAAQMMQAAIAAAGGKGELKTFSGLGDAAGKVVDSNSASVVFTKGNNLIVIYAQSAASAGTDLDGKIEQIAQGIAAKL